MAGSTAPNRACHDHGLYYNSVDFREPAGHSVGHAAPEVACDNELLRDILGLGGYVGGDVRDDLQRQRADLRVLAFWTVYVRRVELAGRVFLDRVHPASVLHQRGSLLCHREAAQVQHQHDEESCSDHAAQHVALPGRHQLRAHLHGLVHHAGAAGLHKPASGSLRIPG